MSKQKIRAVVDMHCGRIESVVIDAQNVELDLVFLEDPSQGSEIEEEFEVQKGVFKGQIVYTRQVACSVNSDVTVKDIDHAFRRSDEREKYEASQ